MKNYKFSNKRSSIKHCPCGRSNSNGKFASFEGYENKGHCFSCDKSFFPKNEESLPQLKIIEDNKQIKNYHEYSLVVETGKNFKNNNFVIFLLSLFTAEQVREVVLKYLISTSTRWCGSVIFWQIDQKEKVRAGKVLQYDVLTGKRAKDKDGKSLIDWVHSIQKRRKVLEEFNLRQCLFGLHLINETDSRTIAIVEAEKTAIMMSIFKPEYTWLATGSKSGFKYELLLPIKDCKIIAFPDKGEFNGWSSKACELNKWGFNISVSDYIEQQNDYDQGTDLADVYIDLRFNVKYTETEKAIHKIEKYAPVLRQLINTFDLVDYYGNEISKKAKI